MRNRVWWLVSVAPAALLLSGCEYDLERQRLSQERDLDLAQLPMVNGYNTPYIVFWICLAVVMVIASIALAVMRIRVARHEANAQVQIAREKNRRLQQSPDRIHEV